jgi:hypothetical protein
MIRAFHVEHILILTFLSLVAGFPAAAEPIPGNRVLAQTEPTEAAPEPLLPGIGPGPLEAPPPEDPTGPAAETPADGSALELDIEIGELRAIDPDSGGLLEPSMGGLGIGMWEGVSRRLLLRLLPQLPDRYESPALHELARRLLLSTAIVPPRTESETGGGVMAARIEKLEAMGLSGAVADMLDLVPEGTRDPTLLRILIDDRLLAGDDDGACAVSATAGDVLTGTYWEKFLVFCQARAGDSAAANFGISLLSEAGNAEDPAYFKMVGALLTGGKPKVRSLPAPTPLHLALARATGTPLPSDVLETKSLAVLRALVDDPAVSDAVRLEAAELAALAGAIDAARLADHYTAIEFSEKEIAKALTRAEADHSPRNRALLYQAAQRQELPVGRAAAMQKAWQLARADDIYRLSIGVYLPMLEELKPASLTWFAADAARALYALDRLEKAGEWVLAAGRFTEEPEYRQRGDLLWPLVALAEGSARGPGQAEWLAALRARAGADAGLKAGLAYALFEAMGERMREEDWMALLDGVSRAPALAADPAYLRQFRRAASAGRRGETVLLALLILGRGGVADAGPQLVSEIIVGLRMVRLEEEARRLALEAALQGGL